MRFDFMNLFVIYVAIVFVRFVFYELGVFFVMKFDERAVFDGWEGFLMVRSFVLGI